MGSVGSRAAADTMVVRMAAALGAMAAASGSGAAAASGLLCADEAAQLFPVDIELLDAGRNMIFSSRAGGGG